MKFQVPDFISKLLTNKIVLYLIAFLSITNVIGYMMMNNLNAVIIFILVGFLASRFSKNMTVILLAPLLIVNFLMTTQMIKEGMTSKPNKAKKAAKKAAKREHMENMDDEEEEDVSVEVKEEETEAEPNEAFEVGTKARKGASRIDYGTTVENAYDDLNKIIGGDGIKRLTEDTQRLMEQQTKLAEAMNNMGPLLNSAKDMLKGFDMSNMGNISEMIKSLQGN